MSKNNTNKRLFLIAAILTITFAGLEIVYGIISGSLMIIGDGVHMSSDAISLFLSLIAAVLASKPITSKKTFGFKRFEPIAAFINGITLILLPMYIIYEAITRFIHPVDIVPKQMIIVGIIGLFVNMLVGFILSKGNQNLNMRSASLHVFADMITSLSAIIVGFAILYFNLTFLDPIGSIITSFIIIRGGIKITKEAFNILMEGTPEGYSTNDLSQSIEGLLVNGVIEDIKIWCINEEDVYALIKIQTEEEISIQKLKNTISKENNIPINHIFIDTTMKV